MAARRAQTYLPSSTILDKHRLSHIQERRLVLPAHTHQTWYVRGSCHTLVLHTSGSVSLHESMIWFFFFFFLLLRLLRLNPTVATIRILKRNNTCKKNIGQPTQTDTAPAGRSSLCLQHVENDNTAVIRDSPKWR